MAMFDAMLAVDPNSLASAAGLAGKVYAATDTARTTPLAVTDLNGIPYANQQIVAGVNGFIPPFLVPGDIVSVVWVSGPWVFPIKSVDGVHAENVAIKADVATLKTQVGAGGGGGGTTTVDGLTDATTIGRALVKAADATTARNTIGAGSSNLVIGTTSTTAARGNNVVTLSEAQVIGGRKTFSDSPVVPPDSFTQDRIVGLLSRLDSLDTRANLIAVDSITSPIPDTARTGDWIAVRTASAGGGTGGGGTTPIDTATYRRALLTGLTDGQALPQTLGTNDTALSVTPAGTNTVRTRNGRTTVEVGVGAQTARWTDLVLTASEWSFEIELEIDTASNTSSTIYQLSNVFLLSLAPGRTLAVANSAGTPVGSISPALTLSTLATPQVYHLKGWKAAADTITHFRLYDPTDALVWDVTRDVGVTIPTTVIWGRTGPITTGKHFWSNHRFHNVGTELA